MRPNELAGAIARAFGYEGIAPAPAIPAATYIDCFAPPWLLRQRLGLS